MLISAQVSPPRARYPFLLPLHAPAVLTHPGWFPLGYVVTGMKTIVEAINSGDPSAVRVVANTIGGHEAAKQLSALRINDDLQLETIVMLAARSGDTKMFHVVLRSLRNILAEGKVLVMDK